MTKIFEITDKSLKVSIATFFSFNEHEFEFEIVGNRSFRKKSIPLTTAIPTVLFLIGIIVTVVESIFMGEKNNSDDIILYVILFSIFITLTFLNKIDNTSLIISNLKPLEFYTNSPDQQTVVRFLEKLRDEQKTYFLKKYTRIDLYTSDEQLLLNFKWLYDRGVINDVELDKLRNNLYSNSNIKPKGFNFNINNN